MVWVRSLVQKEKNSAALAIWPMALMASARTSGDESVTMGWRATTFSSLSILPIARTAVRRVAMSGLLSPVSIGASADESLARASSASSMRWRTNRSGAFAEGGPD